MKTKIIKIIIPDEGWVMIASIILRRVEATMDIVKNVVGDWLDIHCSRDISEQGDLARLNKIRAIAQGIGELKIDIEKYIDAIEKEHKIYKETIQ